MPVLPAVVSCLSVNAIQAKLPQIPASKSATSQMDTGILCRSICALTPELTGTSNDLRAWFVVQGIQKKLHQTNAHLRLQGLRALNEICDRVSHRVLLDCSHDTPPGPGRHLPGANVGVDRHAGFG